jgi:hypothetical protein
VSVFRIGWSTLVFERYWVRCPTTARPVVANPSGVGPPFGVTRHGGRRKAAEGTFTCVCYQDGGRKLRNGILVGRVALRIVPATETRRLQQSLLSRVDGFV